jgi:hypothetical protein
MEPRELSATLTEIAEGLLSTRRRGVAVRARRIELDLPVEIRLFAPVAGTPVLSGSLPVWRWRTVFDQRPNRLLLTWIESPP